MQIYYATEKLQWTHTDDPVKQRETVWIVCGLVNLGNQVVTI
ncbi:hypothetical protein [Tuanshanicoccus lijuaniae]